MKKSVTLYLFIVLFASTALAQEKPFRIGLKFGVPNIVGFNAEYVTPLLVNRLAVTGDFSYFSLSSGDVKFSFSYMELGGNYYLIKEGKGLYGHLSYGRIGFKGTYTDPQFGEGEGTLGINLLNLKLGAKLGNLFYFRPEIGYASLIGGNTVEVSYTDPVTNEQFTEKETVPGVLSGGVLFNIGFGFAF